MKATKKLPEAELEIMLVVWDETNFLSRCYSLSSLCFTFLLLQISSHFQQITAYNAA